MQWAFSVLLFILTCVRLGYTTHLPPGDPLNSGHDFYGTSSIPFSRTRLTQATADPIVAELLVCSILALGTVPFV